METKVDHCTKCGTPLEGAPRSPLLAWCAPCRDVVRQRMHADLGPCPHGLEMMRCDACLWRLMQSLLNGTMVAWFDAATSQN